MRNSKFVVIRKENSENYELVRYFMNQKNTAFVLLCLQPIDIMFVLSID